MPARKPNILIVMVDQLAAQFLPAYGHEVVKAPNLDRLAAEGVVFDAMYSPSPLCSPARAVFMTGQLPSRTGAYDNAAEFRSAIPTFAHYLRLSGYRTCLSGKMHFVGPDQLHGFEERLTTDIYPADFGWTPDWRLSLKDERIDWWYHNMTSVKQAGVAEITNQLEFDDEVAFQAVRKLYDYARYERDTPFCLCVSFTHPHDPYASRRRFWDLYRDDEIDMPQVGALPYERQDAHGRRLWDMSAMDDYDISNQDLRDSRRGYYASISYLDAKIGELMHALEACGLAGDTVVLFTSDHGDFLGERGLWYKMSFREPSARIPLIVHAPGRFAPRHIREPASLADILPTLVDIARPGVADDLPVTVDGRSLYPLLNGAEEDPDATVLGEYLAEGVRQPMFMIRRGRFKFITCGDDPDQLFDLEADPNEQVNLADEPGSPIAEFRAEAADRWDREEIEAAVLASQQARHVVFSALRLGTHTPWDHQPHREASEQYTRNHMDVTEKDQLSRLPPAPVPAKRGG